jgi:putative addiction module component (TIGR02574 family)
MSAAERIFEEALELPEPEREELVARIVDSLGHERVPGVLGPEDMPEIRRRAQDALSGVPGITVDQLRDRLRAK